LKRRPASERDVNAGAKTKKDSMVIETKGKSLRVMGMKIYCRVPDPHPGSTRPSRRVRRASAGTVCDVHACATCASYLRGPDRIAARQQSDTEKNYSLTTKIAAQSWLPPRRRCLPGKSTSGCTTRMWRVSASLRLKVFSSTHSAQRTFCLIALWMVSSWRVRS